MMTVIKISRIIVLAFVACLAFLLLPMPLQAYGPQTYLHINALAVKRPLLGAESAAYYDENNQASTEDEETEYEEEDYDDGQQEWFRYGMYFIVSILVALGRKVRSTTPSPSADDMKKVAEQVEKDDNYYKALLEKWAGKLRPTEFAFSFSDANSRQLLIKCSDYFINTGILEADEEGIILVAKRDGLSPEEKRVLDFLEREGDLQDEADGVIILEKLAMYIKTLDHKYQQFNREIQKAMEEKVTAKLPESQIEELKNDRKDLTHYVEYLCENGMSLQEKVGDHYLYLVMLALCDEKLTANGYDILK